jgi:MtN3 and saliva related transmembrane protein
MLWIELVGYSAGVLIAFTMIPQIIQSIRTKSVKDVSVYMIIVFIVGLFLWTIYGILIKSVPIIISDGFGCCIGIIQLVIKLKYNK